MAPKRTPSLVEGTLPDGRTFRLVPSGARLCIETFLGTQREPKHWVRDECNVDAVAKILGVAVDDG